MFSGTLHFKRKRKYEAKNAFTSYMFYGTDFEASDLPLPRKKNHLWTLLHEESPMNNYIFSHVMGIKLFNYTATFSRFSDFPLTTQYIPSLEYFTDRKPIPIAKKNRYRQEGLAPVMYLQSHCHVASYRDQYVKELMNFIEIDSYGKCLHNKDLPSNLISTDTHNDEELFEFISKYKFHIAYENALCDDYITEKFFRALHVGVVPIYKGSSTVKDWAPAELSVIVIDNFTSPQELANFIHQLDQNDELYNSYLQFKENGVSNDFLKNNVFQRSWGINNAHKIDFIRGFECFVCDEMHALNKLLVPTIANRNHMNCLQPHTPLGTEYVTREKFEEDWIENFWYAFDLARAVQLMIQNKDNSTSNLRKYLSQLRYKN